MNIAIRPATERDYDAIAGLYQQVQNIHAQNMPDFYEPATTSVIEQDQFNVFCKSDSDCLLAAEFNGVVVGFAHAALTELHRPLFPIKRRVVIEGIGVDENYRRKGIGTSLIRAAEAWANEKNADYINLSVRPFNRNAIATYEAAGYSVDMFRMGKFLSGKEPA